MRFPVKTTFIIIGLRKPVSFTLNMNLSKMSTDWINFFYEHNQLLFWGISRGTSVLWLQSCHEGTWNSLCCRHGTAVQVLTSRWHVHNRTLYLNHLFCCSRRPLTPVPCCFLMSLFHVLHFSDIFQPDDDFKCPGFFFSQWLML